MENVSLQNKKQYIPTMLGLEIQINNDTPVTVAAENFSFVLLDTAMRQDDTRVISMHMDLISPTVTIGSVSFRAKETK